MLFDTEEFASPVHLAAFPPASGAVRSVALLEALRPGGEGRAAVLVSSSEAGEVVATLTSLGTWPPVSLNPPEMLRAVLPTMELGDGSDGAIRLAAGPRGRVFGGAESAVALYDVARSLEGAETEALWSADWAPPPPPPPSPPPGPRPPRAPVDVSDDADLADVLAHGLALSDAPDPSAAASAHAHGGDEPRVGFGGGGAHDPTAARAGAEPSRLLDYSPCWRLLAAAMESGVVALWDPRAPGGEGPAASVRLPNGEARWVSLDDGHSLGGHLLASTASGPVHVYDVRRACTGRGAAAARGARGVAVLASPPGAGFGCGCFGAADSVLVVGGGAKGKEALRYTVGADDGPEDEGGPTPGAGSTAASREKAKRLQPSKNKMAGSGKTKMSYGSKR